MSAAGVVSSLDVLRQFAGKRRSVESCELCGAELASDHPHLVDPKAHKLLCTCRACALLFSAQSGSRYKRVPERIHYLPEFRLTDAQWEGLMIPINMAFFFESSVDARVMALYPSPAGATESLLSFDTWEEIEIENPTLFEMEADVEALIIEDPKPSLVQIGMLQGAAL